ncbi:MULTISPECIES: nitrogen fixation protein NifM [Pseudomonas]|uniref:peptidylprolyl isomerase n=1 Tax=Pseudomonas kuykendallii TaxID=1007099 RepID=A0A2W5CW61_9PSED|nr:MULTISPECIES: nitrogen fixation protein NifM [Pseudomonas]PZP22278.1 MAG: nitrogen fixation protein NifM [Pseudomonas kuykendallii]
MTAIDQENLAYMTLKSVQARFDCEPAQLTESQKHEAQQHAQRQYRIETAVLASPMAQDVHVPASTVEDAFARIRQRYEAEADFLEGLERAGLGEAGLRRALLWELRVEAVMDRVAQNAKQIDPVDEELFYLNHLDRFHLPERRKVRHILITINDQFADNHHDAALKRIRQIAEQLKRHPRRFSQLAQRYSECPTAMNGGLLGEMPRGKLYPELDQVLFNLARGQISGPLRSPIGFHLLSCDSITQAKRMRFAEARPSIHELLDTRVRRATQRDWIRSLFA